MVEARTGREPEEHSAAIIAPDGAGVGHAAWASRTGLSIHSSSQPDA
ncbi:hypothetical protein RISK_001376 [Rhodopirellula islandica]|uniref:Uncharacterized protein n=1 Tax=Rhodopirellula islandica TaxID=595434 RepID=A0A0J1BJ90_RHOIS|nr:hypothetical protein RISK_001376 [Rhodopirellula islandica]